MAEKRFRYLRTVIGARLHENHYSEPVVDNTNLSNVCVLILVTCCRILWLFQWRFWRVTPSLMTSGSSMWPSTQPNPGCFPQGPTGQSVFSPREQNENSPPSGATTSSFLNQKLHASYDSMRFFRLCSSLRTLTCCWQESSAWSDIEHVIIICVFCYVLPFLC